MSENKLSKRIVYTLAFWCKGLFFISLQLSIDSLKDLPRDKEETSQERARTLPERAAPNKEGRRRVDVWSEWAEEELRDRSKVNNMHSYRSDVE